MSFRELTSLTYAPANDRSGYGANVYGGPPDLHRSGSFDQRGGGTVIDPSTGLVQANGLIPSSSNTYGALGIGISANGTKGDGAPGEKKKKVRSWFSSRGGGYCEKKGGKLSFSGHSLAEATR